MLNNLQIKLDKVARSTLSSTIVKRELQAQILPLPKDELSSLFLKDVYKMSYSCGEVYIGLTGWSIKTPLSEGYLQTGLPN